MLVELGNHNAKNGVDDAPKVTRIHVPEFDDGSLHPDGVKLGGYTHKPGALTVDELRDAYLATVQGGGLVAAEDALPDHELLLTVVNQWPEHGSGRPAWVKVSSFEDTHGDVEGVASHGQDSATEVEELLAGFWRCDQGRPADLEDRYWTVHGAPGHYLSDPRPPIENVYTNNGRVLNNYNDGGGTLGAIGTGTAATATTLTTASTFTTNQWAGYRVYAMQTATGPLVWGNIVSNTNAAGASVLTVDQWYNVATPGGSPATTPSGGYYFMIADGGGVSSWFQALDLSSTAPANVDTALGTEYPTAAGGLYRKICTVGTTSGVASRSVQLTATYTVNGSDTGLPRTIYAVGVFTSMVPAAAMTMKFHSGSAAGFTQATVSAIGDQLSTTFSLSGS